MQTGVQFLTGFLLTLPFQQKFAQLSQPQVDLYLATVSASIAATAFLRRRSVCTVPYFVGTSGRQPSRWRTGWRSSGWCCSHWRSLGWRR